jgi:hypothetical protein
MFIVLRQFELNTLVRRRDDENHADLTRARVLENSLRFSETEVRQALKTVVSGVDQLLFLDLRILPDLIHKDHAPDLPPLELPDRDRFVYREQPRTKALKTYRLEYLLSRQSRAPHEAYEEEIDGELTLVQPAPETEIVRSSLECELDGLRDAIKLVSSSANGFLSWLRITLHDDAYRGDRPIGAFGHYAEPASQITI